MGRPKRESRPKHPGPSSIKDVVAENDVLEYYLKQKQFAFLRYEASHGHNGTHKGIEKHRDDARRYQPPYKRLPKNPRKYN